MSYSPAVLTRFDRVCEMVAGSRRGFTPKLLGLCHALARAIEAGDTERVSELAAHLGIAPDALEVHQMELVAP